MAIAPTAHGSPRAPSRAAPEPPAETAEPRPPHAPLPLKVGVFLSFVGVVLLEPGLPANTAFIDPVIGLVLVFGVLTMFTRGSVAVRGFARCSPWMWLFLIGSFTGLAHVGITYWAMYALVRTVFALLTFFAVWHLIEVYALERVAMRGIAAGAALATLALVVTDSSWRGQGWFPNPNYAGHFGVCYGAVLVLLAERRALRAFGVVVIVIAITTSSSFGAIAMVIAMVAIIVARNVRRHSAFLTVALAALVIAAGVLLSAPPQEVPEQDTDTEVTSPLSQNRFERSQSGRLRIWGEALDKWRDEPLGVGPNGIDKRELVVGRQGTGIEIHSNWVGVLVDRGPFGLIGWIGLWVVLWRLSEPGGVARLLIAADVVAGIFRETMHYRHLWLALALCMVIDRRRARAREDEEATHLEPIGGMPAAADAR